MNIVQIGTGRPIQGVNIKKLIITFLFFILSSPAWSATKYWVGGGSSTDWAATGNTNWSNSNGGANNATVPAAGDDVIDNGSADMAIGTNTNSLNSIDLSAGTGNFSGSSTILVRGSNSTTVNIKFPSAPASFTWSGLLSIATGGTSRVYDLTTNGNTLSGGLTVNPAAGGTFNLEDTTNFSTGTVTFTIGSLVTNGNTLTMGILSSTNTNTRTLDITNSTVNIGGTGTVISMANESGLTWTLTGSTINITDNSSSTKTVTLGSTTSVNVSFNKFSISGGGTGSVTLTGSSATLFGNLIIGAPKTIVFTKSTSFFLNNLTANGSSGNVITMSTNTSGTSANLFFTTPLPFNVSLNWVSLKDLPVGTSNVFPNINPPLGNTKFYAGANSTLVSDDAGWILASPPTYNDQLTGNSNVTGTSKVN